MKPTYPHLQRRNKLANWAKTVTNFWAGKSDPDKNGSILKIIQGRAESGAYGALATKCSDLLLLVAGVVALKGFSKRAILQKK
jgi:hypothetical protein